MGTLTILQLVVAGLAAFAGSTVLSSIGFGIGIVATPLLLLVLDPQSSVVMINAVTVPLVGYDDSLVGVLQVLNKEEGVFTEKDEHIATALGAQCAVALQRARMLEELLTKEKMERELAVAREIQMRVLPKEVPDLPGYDIAGWSRPADQTGGEHLRHHFPRGSSRHRRRATG